MKSFFVALLFYLTPALSGALPKRDQSCRCIYGQSCWPGDAQFSDLASQLSQPLVRPLPVAAPCYSAGADAACAQVKENWNDGMWRADQPGNMININFASHTFPNGTISACYVNTALSHPCTQGSVPPIGVDARNLQDIQAAIRFADTHNLKLVIKNTGHDYLGRSTGRGAFMIWTHHLQDKTYVADFVAAGAPQGTTPQRAITLGAGVQWKDAYAFAAANNRFILGGISSDGSVGAAGGWIQGGGHSAFAPKHGLGVDNVLQFTVVASNGEHVTVNQHQHASLFWALRGGGPGSWGVITSTTYATHDEFPLSMGFVFANFSTTPESSTHAIFTEFIKTHPTLSDAGWGGYSWLSKYFFVASWVAPGVSWADMNSTFLPFVDFVTKNAGEGGQVQAFTAEFPSFQAWSTGAGGTAGELPISAPTQIGTGAQLGSRLLPRKIAVEDPARAATIILETNDIVAFNSVAGGAVSRPDPSSAALHPGWRNAIAHVYVSASFPEGATAAENAAAIEQMKAQTDILDKLTTDSASYVNEGSLHERDFRRAYYGEHYNQLLQIKSQYDPKSLFIVPAGVSSENWDAEQLCKV